jgi:hypothetical protein
MRKSSPQLLFAGGIIGVVGSTILACRATLKLSETVDEVERQVEEVKILRLEDDNRHQELIRVYASGAGSIIKLYGPSIVIGGLSIAALTGSHVTLTRRNTALMAAYSAISSSFEAYRERVRAQIGVDNERDIYHAIESYVEVDGTDGKKKELVPVIDPNKMSQYARFFDEASPNWQKHPEYNRVFVQCQQNWLNDLLQARGHVFLNEVYDALGIPHSQAGAVVGWVIGNGDNFIDFNMFDAYNSRFVNGMERSILLDFNVDGVIWNLLG